LFAARIDSASHAIQHRQAPIARLRRSAGFEPWTLIKREPLRGSIRGLSNKNLKNVNKLN
jgi:hypothetical protein